MSKIQFLCRYLLSLAIVTPLMGISATVIGSGFLSGDRAEAATPFLIAQQYKPGDTVYIKHTSGVWYVGTVESYDATANTYQVVFAHQGRGTTAAFPVSDIISKDQAFKQGIYDGVAIAAGDSAATPTPQPAPTAPATPATPTPSAAPTTAAPTTAAAPSATGFGVGDTIYYYDVNSGSWKKGTIGAVFDKGLGLNEGPMVRKTNVISAADAQKRGVAEGSTPSDRAQYVQSLHANLRQVSSGDPLIDAIVAEHNKIRRDPKAYAQQLKAKRQALLDERTTGVGNPDDPTTAQTAIDTVIQDLEALEPLPPLLLSKEGSMAAKYCLETRKGQHCDIPTVVGQWEKNGFKFSGTRAAAESSTGISDRVSTPQEKTEKAVQ